MSEQRDTASAIENYGILLAGRYGIVMQYAKSSICFTKSGFKQLFSTKEFLYKFSNCLSVIKPVSGG
jgi:hypothetical protein